MPTDAAPATLNAPMPFDRARARRDPVPPVRRGAAGGWQDRAFERLTQGFAVLVLATLVAILVALAISAWPALDRFGLGFFFTNTWNPVTSVFGGLAPIYGTLVTSLIALAIGVPVSFGIALVLTEMAPAALKRPLGTAVELLAAIPSIIYGMWGLFVFAPLFGDHVRDRQCVSDQRLAVRARQLDRLGARQ